MKKPGFSIRPTDFRAQNIDGTTLDIYRMVIAAFLVMDKTNRVRFFKEIVLVANVHPKIVFGMFSLTLSSTDIDILDWELR